ncbi:hypothetical protein ACJEDT_26075 (plasmid) [Rhodococcoides fascians]|uniref:hypothetical protein n=1 Tax=Rhodococcoides fascians TaxID=1828 RepID=UPI00389B0F3C
MNWLITECSFATHLPPDPPIAHTVHAPSCELMPLMTAAQRYSDASESVVIIAGKRYGMGSSRDWAAKVVRLLGARAVLARSFERIHRSNPIGLLPLIVPSDAVDVLATCRPPGGTVYVDAPADSLHTRTATVTLIRADGASLETPSPSRWRRNRTTATTRRCHTGNPRSRVDPLTCAVALIVHRCCTGKDDGTKEGTHSATSRYLDAVVNQHSAPPSAHDRSARSACDLGVGGLPKCTCYILRRNSTVDVSFACGGRQRRYRSLRTDDAFGIRGHSGRCPVVRSRAWVPDYHPR